MTTKDGTSPSVLDLFKTAILETVQEIGPGGSPSGTMYASMMAVGMSYDTYNALINQLVAEQLIEVRNHVLYPVPHRQRVR
jgi:hypothetical protein